MNPVLHSTKVCLASCINSNHFLLFKHLHTASEIIEHIEYGQNCSFPCHSDENLNWGHIEDNSEKVVPTCKPDCPHTFHQVGSRIGENYTQTLVFPNAKCSDKGEYLCEDSYDKLMKKINLKVRRKFKVHLIDSKCLWFLMWLPYISLL